MSFLEIIGIILMTLAGTFGAMFFKRASLSFEKKTLIKILKDKNLYIGGGFYLLGAVLNILLLKTIDYTIIYPMTSLTYVWTMFISYLVFKERINIYKVIAIVLIIGGAITINL